MSISSILLSPSTAAGDHFLSPRVFFPSPISHSTRLNFNPKLSPRPPSRRSLIVFQNPDESSTSTRTSSDNEDFITKVLRENPSQVETKYLVGDRLVTLREKQISREDESFQASKLARRFIGDGKSKGSSNSVQLADILKEIRGKLYVPDDVFRASLSEEEEFERDMKELPVMSFEEFLKHLEADKVKMLTSKSLDGISPDIEYRDFVVELKDILRDNNSLQKTRW